MSDPSNREISDDLVAAMHQSTGSYELVIAMIAAAGVGYLIDRAAGTTPIFLLIFAIAGFIGAGYSIKLNYDAQMEVEQEARLSRRDRVIRNESRS